MAVSRLVVNVIFIALVNSLAIEHDSADSGEISEVVKSDLVSDIHVGESDIPNNAFNGVYTECFLHLSYTCLQKKTLLYLKELDKLSEISVIGDYVKFVKLNTTDHREGNEIEESKLKNSEELSHMIDKAVDRFFNNHFIRLSALGKDVLVPHSVEEFVGRKRRKGGGGGGGSGGGDGGKKKMMMMAMMCMKMKLMMVPAMMGMMGMMSFKGMMFSMMSFMISKMMLLMKILEKKGGGGGGGGGGGDGSWAGGGGGGGAWMPAGGPDYGGGGGYDANAQWSSRSILEKVEDDKIKIVEKPIITYVKPVIRYNNNVNDKKPFVITKNLNDELIKANNNLFDGEVKSRRKRGIMDVLQSAYLYWANKVLGFNNYKLKHPNYPKYKIINGVKYVYYPIRQIQKVKAPKELAVHNVKATDEIKPVVIAEDFNKGEIVEGAVESRMSRKKFHKMKDNVNETMDDNPWQ